MTIRVFRIYVKHYIMPMQVACRVSYTEEAYHSNTLQNAKLTWLNKGKLDLFFSVLQHLHISVPEWEHVKSMDHNLEISGSSAAVFSVYPDDVLGCSCCLGPQTCFFKKNLSLSLKSVKRSVVNPIET